MDLLEQKLSRVDLNLLVSLSVLLKEKNVSRAAERLYLSQSAMSRTLQRLRDLFEDPLFHRTASGIIPTEKAQSIEALLPDLLQQIEAIFQQEEFSPSHCDKHFGISMPASMSHAFFLPLMKNISLQAPLVQLTEFPAKANPYKLLEIGELDFAIHVEKPTDPTLNVTSLGKLSPVVFVRKSHPLTQLNDITLKDCLAYRFLDFIVDDKNALGFTNPIDKLMLKSGTHRNVQLKSSQFSILTAVLKTSDTLLIGPDFLMDSAEHKDEFVAVYQFKENKSHMIDLYLIEHQRVENSAAHQWLKTIILEQVTALGNLLN